MKKREQGILTVEASIVLTLCILFILFLFSFARVYNAQSLVSHAVIQASDAVALESYLRESTFAGSEADVIELANRFNGTTSLSADSFTSLRSADVQEIAKEKFAHAISNNETAADEKLKRLGVKDGLSGIDFSSTRIDLGNDDVIVFVSYTIEMQFPAFGMSEIHMTKAAKSKTFGDILFGIETVAENPIMGSASGGGNYKYGTQIQISATPNYGYKFVKWADGSTANPRTVTVAGAKTYVAIFQQSEFGVNLESSPSSAGSTSGGGTYKYLDEATIVATPAAGYHFKNWSVYKHNDNTTGTLNDASTRIVVDQSYTCTANFGKNSYNVKVKTEGVSGGSAYIIYNNRNSSSINAEYQSSFQLSAPAVSGYKFLGWKEEGGSRFSSSATVPMTVPAKNITYVACYESTLRTVTFYNRDGSVHATRQVYEGHSLGGNMPGRPYSVDYKFNGWNGFDANTIVYNDMSVTGNWSTCRHKNLGHCGKKHSLGGKYYNEYAPSKGHYSSSHWQYFRTCQVCVDCGKVLWNLCGSCTSWKSQPWVNVHGLSKMDDIWKKTM